MKAASNDVVSTDTPTQALVLLLGLKRWSNILNKSCNVISELQSIVSIYIVRVVPFFHDSCPASRLRQRLVCFK